MLKRNYIIYFGALITTVATWFFYVLQDLTSWYIGVLNIPIGIILLFLDVGASFIFLQEHPLWRTKICNWLKSTIFYHTVLIAYSLYFLAIIASPFAGAIVKEIAFNPIIVMGFLILGNIAISAYVVNAKGYKIKPLLFVYVLLLAFSISLNLPDFVKYFPFPAVTTIFAYITLTITTIGILFLVSRRPSSEGLNQKVDKLQDSFLHKPLISRLSSITIGLVIVLVIFSALSIPRLNDPVMGDEFHQFNAAVGLLETGVLWEWNFITQEIFNEYSRSWPTTYLHAGSIGVFGINETAARLPSFIAGLLVLILLYRFAFYVTQSKNIALGATLMMATNPWFVWYATYIRMYIFLLLASLLFFFTLSKIFTLGKTKYAIHFVIAACIFGTLGALIHETFFALLPATIIYLLIRSMALIRRDKQAILIPKLLLIGITLIMLFAPLLLFWKEKLLSPFQSYFEATTGFVNSVSIFSFFTFPALLALLLIILGGVIFFYQKAQPEARRRFLFISFFFVAIHITYAFFSNVPHVRYITVVLPLNVILLTTGLFYFFRLWGPGRRLSIAILLSTVAIFNVVMWYSPTIHQYNESIENTYTARNIFHTHPEEDSWVNFPEALGAIKEVYTKDMLIMGASVPIQSYYFQQVFPANWRYIHIPKEPSHYEFLNIEGKGRFLTLAEVRELVQKNEKGMFIWMSRKESSLTDNPEGLKIVQYVRSEFQKISGIGVDNSNLEVYIW